MLVAALSTGRCLRIRPSVTDVEWSQRRPSRLAVGPRRRGPTLKCSQGMRSTVISAPRVGLPEGRLRGGSVPDPRDTADDEPQPSHERPPHPTTFCRDPRSEPWVSSRLGKQRPECPPAPPILRQQLAQFARIGPVLPARSPASLQAFRRSSPPAGGGGLHRSGRVREALKLYGEHGAGGRYGHARGDLRTQQRALGGQPLGLRESGSIRAARRAGTVRRRLQRDIARETSGPSKCRSPAGN